jgi:hypothetical protein
MYALTPACCHGLPERASGSDSECPILDNHEMPTIFAARSITCEHSLRHLARRRCILKSERRAGQLAMFANRRNSAAAALRIGYFSSMGHLQRNRGAQLNWPVLQTTERCPALRRRLAMFRRGRPGPNRRSRPNWLCSANAQNEVRDSREFVMFHYVLQIDEMAPRALESGDHYRPTIVAVPSTAYERPASQLTSRGCRFKAGRRCKFAMFRSKSEMAWARRQELGMFRQTRQPQPNGDRNKLAMFCKSTNRWALPENWLGSANGQTTVRPKLAPKLAMFCKSTESGGRCRELAMFRKRASDGQVKVALKLAMFGKSRNTMGASQQLAMFSQQPNSNQSKVALKLAMFCKSAEPRRSPHNWLCSEKTTGPHPTLV